MVTISFDRNFLGKKQKLQKKQYNKFYNKINKQNFVKQYKKKEYIYTVYFALIFSWDTCKAKCVVFEGGNAWTVS